jgi:2-polyprenyl-3-methyl-5-hydroxy-6-metoxy-1,4-benzoquinol methylase
LLEQVRVADLDSEYRRQYGVIVQGEFEHVGPLLSLWRCASCRLEHFAPLVAGRADFYDVLARLPGYYTQGRWEFAETTRRLGSDVDLVDVGCGDGEFLRGVHGSHKRGLEFNAEAVKRAGEQGLNVSMATLASLPGESADVVTMFQVIEHVADPAALIRDAVRVLRPEGRLFLSAPNNDAYVGSAVHDPMNAPPHHPLRWRGASFEALPAIVPLALVSLTPEPLSAPQMYHYHRARYFGALRDLSGTRLPLHRVGAAMTLLRRSANLWAMAMTRLNPRPAPDALGPTLLAELRRIPTPAPIADNQGQPP